MKSNECFRELFGIKVLHNNWYLCHFPPSLNNAVLPLSLCFSRELFVGAAQWLACFSLYLCFPVGTKRVLRLDYLNLWACLSLSFSGLRIESEMKRNRMKDPLVMCFWDRNNTELWFVSPERHDSRKYFFPEHTFCSDVWDRNIRHSRWGCSQDSVNPVHYF